VVSSLNADFQPRRIERALAMIGEAGAEPVIVLTKLDLCPDWSVQRRALANVALGVRVHAVSAQSGEGMAALEQELLPRCTIALIGSSGTGKSTLVNRWLGAAQLATHAIREHDDRGRHTTTHRELFVLPGGALLIDTPGMRELALWDAESGLDAAFADIEALAQACRFADCQHHMEPDCALRSAIERGELEPQRYENYRKLQRELAYTRRQQDERARAAHRRDQRGLQRQRSRALRARKRFE
jgi:ribosome biogenesis GTPase